MCIRIRVACTAGEKKNYAVSRCNIKLCLSEKKKKKMPQYDLIQNPMLRYDRMDTESRTRTKVAKTKEEEGEKKLGQSAGVLQQRLETDMGRCVVCQRVTV